MVRYPQQADLLEIDRPRYHVIASNRVGSTADVLVWYRQRGECSENGIKELKSVLGWSGCLVVRKAPMQRSSGLG
ncbi:hypothetical protein HF923_02395 [Acidithiobacillus ferriphilus]|uniref:hypothetical protein n=1 Tax=Acidithiobacillus ferriphilus TaxID=1689834 RepID=UPI001C073584|nr:hypothetical protein [Acidithiobacillus ferriphilus]MBU2844694.1 hypothetical protein [Acidithiobacillus ferriphilus]